MNKNFFILLMIVVTVLALEFSLTADKSQSFAKSVVQNIFKFSTALKKDSQNDKSSTKFVEKNNETTTEVDRDEKLQIFLSEEAEHLEDSSVNTEEIAKNYAAQAQALTPPLILNLTDLVLNPQENIRQRILGVYLLIQNQSAESLTALNAIVFDNSEAFQDKPTTTPHSLNEVLQNQNAALFDMAAEEWLKRSLKSVSNPEAFMQDLINSTRNERLKRFLIRKSKPG